MKEKEVRVIKLEPLRAARFHGFGEGPEPIAWQKLVDWAEPRGFLDYSEKHRIFGFNNPNPAPGSPNYGYEFWVTVTPEEASGEDADIVEFPGGLYAVMQCIARDPGTDIPAAWQRVFTWRENSSYQSADHQWLERHLHVGTPGKEDFHLDLYLPIAE